MPKAIVRDTIYGAYPLPFLTLKYHASNRSRPDYFALEMLSLLLAKGKTARLNKALIEKGELAFNHTILLFPGKDSIQITITSIAAPGIDLQDLEVAMEKEITRIKTEKITLWEFEKLKKSD